ncbi:MAG: diguanylate cyclase [Gammaproteobacteria bacterium]|nr:diguanylate cyclase [Gammaproteobacteria bacterium]
MPSANLIERLASLRQDYLSRLPGELAIVADLARRLTNSTEDHATLKELHFRLHSIVGSSGTFGLTALSTECRRLEQRAKAWQEDAATRPAPGDYQAFIDAIAALPGLSVAPDPAVNNTNLAPADSPVPHTDSLPLWLVEPDTALAHDLQRQLQSFGYDVRCFHSLKDARAAANTSLPEILLLELPPESGEYPREAEARLRIGFSAIKCPILILANSNDFDSRARAVRIGADDFFPKPLEVPRLINRMAQLVAQRRSPKLRVLIVDDDTTLADHYRLTLLAAGMEADILQQPRDLIAKLAAFNPELVLMDLYMPEHSGPELAGVIRQHERWTSLPIIYLSAETNLDLQIEALRRGADDFITKPIADASLVALVRARIDRGRQIDTLITRDSLTGLLRHASIKEAASIEMKRAARSGRPLSVAIVDIDHFKKVNDTHGHATGDVVITATANLLRQRLRQSDIIGRYGGEEFLIVLPECSNADAEHLLNDVRQRFATIQFGRSGDEFSCTLSAGVASLDACGQELLSAADAALYQAKAGGRNKICVAQKSAPDVGPDT